MVKYALVCVKTPVFASILMNSDLGLNLKRTAEKVKSSHLYLYSAFNNTNCNKAEIKRVSVYWIQVALKVTAVCYSC